VGLFGGEVGLGAEVEAIAAREKGDRESGDVGEVGVVRFFHDSLIWVEVHELIMAKAPIQKGFRTL